MSEWDEFVARGGSSTNLFASLVDLADSKADDVAPVSGGQRSTSFGQWIATQLSFFRVRRAFVLVSQRNVVAMRRARAGTELSLQRERERERERVLFLAVFLLEFGIDQGNRRHLYPGLDKIKHNLSIN